MRHIEKKHILILILFMFLFIFSGCLNIKCAYIPDRFINEGWYENLSLKNNGLQFFGLEKWCSTTYEIKGKYPAYLTITTYKTLILTDEEELQKNIKKVIEKTYSEKIILNMSSKINGERNLLKNHKSKYIIYNATTKSKNENIKIIGEIWNCGDNGISIICIGISYITNVENLNIKNYKQWEKIVMDPTGIIENFSGESGLIYNTICH
jgi:hypothetical protein